MRRLLLTISLLCAASPALAQAPPTCNLGCAPCGGTPFCRLGCFGPVSVYHASASPCGSASAGGSFNLIGTEYENTCYSGSRGCTVALPPLRFWEYDRYAMANSGCQDPSQGWLANAALDFGVGGTPGHWILYQANWKGNMIDGCPTTPRTVAELSFADTPSEGTPDHFARYLVASVPNTGADYDFDRIVGGSGCNPADIVAARVGGVRPVGLSGACTRNPQPVTGSQNPNDCNTTDFELALDDPFPRFYTETTPPLPPLIAGYQVLYASAADASGEPTTSRGCAGVWQPVRDPADPTRALGVVPLGTSSVIVNVPAAPAPARSHHWFATRLVYQDATVNPTGSFDPATEHGPWVVSQVSGHCGPGIDPPLLPFIPWDQVWKDDGYPAGFPVMPGQPITYTLELTNDGADSDGLGVVVRDVLPSCLDLTGFDPIATPSQVQVTPTPATVSWDAGTRSLEVRFTQTIPARVKNTIVITGPVAAQTGDCCNSAELSARSCVQSFASFRDRELLSGPTCTAVLSEICLLPPPAVTGVQAVRRAGDVNLQWLPAQDPSTALYDVWRVESGDKTVIPAANQLWVGPEVSGVTGCLGIPVGMPQCTDSGAVAAPPTLVFYQVRGACQDGVEGTEHPF